MNEKTDYIEKGIEIIRDLEVFVSRGNLLKTNFGAREKLIELLTKKDLSNLKGKKKSPKKKKKIQNLNFRKRL